MAITGTNPVAPTVATPNITGDSTAGTLVVVSAAVAPADGYTAPGVYGPATIYGDLSYGSGCALGNYFVRGLAGAPTWSLSGPDAALFGLGGPNGGQITSPGLAYVAQKSAFDVTINATCGATTLSKNVVIQAAAGSLQFANWYVLDDAPVVYDPVGGAPPTPNARFIDDMSGTVGIASLTSPDGMIQFTAPGYGNYTWTSETASPLASHHGAHAATLTDTAGHTYAAQFLFIEELPPTARFVQSAPIYSNAPVGQVFGQLSAYSDAGIASITVASPGNFLLVNPSNALMVAAAPATGDVTATVTVTSTTGKITVLEIPFVVGQGINLPASNMTAALSTAIDNSMRNVVIGTVTVTGMTDPVFTIAVANDECQLLTIYGQPGLQPRYAITQTGATATITAASLSAQTDHLVISATSGATSCVATIPFAVAAKVGPLVTVDATKPASATNFPSWNAWNDAYIENPSMYAGSTVHLAHQDYSTDFSTLTPGHGSNEEWAPGPASYIGGSPSNRILIDYQNKDAPDDKGLINCDGSDLTVRNLEVARVLSPNNATAFYHEAQQTGNFSIYDCYARNCGNGFLDGDLGNHVVMDRVIFAFNGAGVVSRDHNCYVNKVSSLTANNILSFGVAGEGHCFKTRALRGTISNSVFAESVNGQASMQLDIPQGGNYTVSNCIFAKGPNAQNGALLSYGEEWNNPTMNPTPLNLVVEGCTFIVACNNSIVQNGNMDSPAAINMGWSSNPNITSPVTGQPMTLTYKNCRFYGIPKANWITNQSGATIVDGGGNIAITEWVDLEAIDPSTGSLIAHPPGPMFQPDNIGPSIMFDALALQYRVAFGAPIGTKIGTASTTDAYGIPLSNPTFSLLNGDGGNFAINPATGVFSTASTAIPDSLRFIAVGAIGTDSKGVKQTVAKWTWIVVGNGTLIMN